jgi:hypothetical protein
MKKELTGIPKNILFGLSFFYLGLYLPITLMTYFPQWYIFNCNMHRRCDYIGYSRALKYIHELTGFLIHKNPLSNDWSVKERMHLAEVRDILDILAVTAIIGIVLFILFFKRAKISKYALVNLVIIGFLLLMVPFFKVFWQKVFHPLLFDNNLWKNTYADISYFIMPRVFFKHSMIFMILFSSLLNGFLWIFFKKYSTPNRKQKNLKGQTKS